MQHALITRENSEVPLTVGNLEQLPDHVETNTGRKQLETDLRHLRAQPGFGTHDTIGRLSRPPFHFLNAPTGEETTQDDVEDLETDDNLTRFATPTETDAHPISHAIPQAIPHHTPNAAGLPQEVVEFVDSVPPGWGIEPSPAFRFEEDPRVQMAARTAAQLHSLPIWSAQMAFGGTPQSDG